MADKSLVDRLVDESDHVNSGWWYVPDELLSAVEVSMRASDSRIEALTKALRALTGCTKEVTNALKACAMFTITDQAARQIALKMVKEGEEAVDTANALLASAAGAEGEA